MHHALLTSMINGGERSDITDDVILSRAGVCDA